MVDYCLTIEDQEHRSKVAQSIIDVIGNLNPAIRDAPDYAHKLWDHLFIMSQFKLEVESPYPIPTAESFVGLPDEVAYRFYWTFQLEGIAHAFHIPLLS